MRTRMLAVIAVSLLFASARAASAYPGYTGFTTWAPVISLAVIASFMIAVIYWIIGYVLNNARVKASAVSEIGQSVGTLIIAILIIVVLGLFGTLIQGFITPTDVSNFCSDFGGSQLNILSTSSSYSLTNNVCSQFSGSTYTGDAQDYGIYSVYALLANMTNNVVANLNSLYIYESYIGFLREFTPFVGVCNQAGGVCVLSDAPRAFAITVYYQPDGGYSLLRNVARPLDIQAFLTFYAFLLQLIIGLIILATWPYMLAGGILLRATFFARRLGGLLMAFALGAVIIFPMLLSIEYLTLSTIGTSATTMAVGVSAIGSNSLTTLPNPGEKFAGLPSPDSLNFFGFPSAETIITDNGCWPPAAGSMPATELEYDAAYIVPGLSLANLLSTIGSFDGSTPGLLISNCNAAQADSTFLALTTMYGYLSVSAYILPLLNVLITLAAIKGLSGLFGGDTDIAGIGKLV